MNHEREDWVNEVLASAEHIQRAAAPAGFYEKTLARIKEDTRISKQNVLRVAAGIALLIGLNIFACVSFAKNEGEQPDQLQAFAREYSLTGAGDNF